MSKRSVLERIARQSQTLSRRSGISIPLVNSSPICVQATPCVVLQRASKRECLLEHALDTRARQRTVNVERKPDDRDIAGP